MALALNNAQGELHPLEVGLHALKSGLSQEVYGGQIGLSQDSISLRIRAAKVAESCLTTHVVTDLADRWRHLAERRCAMTADIIDLAEGRTPASKTGSDPDTMRKVLHRFIEPHLLDDAHVKDVFDFVVDRVLEPRR